VTTLKIAIVKYSKRLKNVYNTSRYVFQKSEMALFVLEHICQGNEVSYHMIPYEKGRPFLVEIDEKDFEVLKDHLKKERPQFGVKIWSFKYYPKYWTDQIKQLFF
jgi:hypothetical protein